MSSQFIINNYYLISLIIIGFSFILLFFRYEKNKPQAREIVVLAILSTIAVISRAAFAMIPFFKPMMGVIMITGMSFGSGAGFLTGTVSGFISNFFFGQGPWTPWQMFAYGIGGALAGFLYKKGIMREDKKLRTAISGYVIIQTIVGPILDTASIFTMGNMVLPEYILAIYLSGFFPNAIHGFATFLTLYLAVGPMTEKLNRIKIKYGLMSEEMNEV